MGVRHYSQAMVHAFGNPFAIPALVGSAVYLWWKLYHEPKRSGARYSNSLQANGTSELRQRLEPRTSRQRNCIIALAVVLFCAGLMEVYYLQACPQSFARVDGNRTIMQTLVTFFDKHHIEYWADFGTLLTVLRGTDIMVHDHDSDFSIIKPPKAEIKKIVSNLEDYFSPECDIYHEVERDFIKVVCDEAYNEIWLWAPNREGTSEYLENWDWTTSHNQRLRSWLVPSRAVEWHESPTGKIYVPREAGLLCEKEFGSNYMTPYLTRFECFENVWNRRLSSTTYLTIFALVGGLVLFLHKRLPDVTGARHSHESDV